MISMLAGEVIEKDLNTAIVDVNGVGYGVFITSEESQHLITGDKVKLYIYEHIRENVHDLFGFIKPSAKQLFERLLNVSGIGPKMAINLLSIGSEQAVRTAIANGDIRFIQGAPGIGKRVAERIIVELKDKVGLSSVDLASTGLLQSDQSILQDEAVSALLALGYTSQDAVIALKDIDPKLPTAERVKAALRSKV